MNNLSRFIHFDKGHRVERKEVGIVLKSTDTVDRIGNLLGGKRYPHPALVFRIRLERNPILIVRVQPVVRPDAVRREQPGKAPQSGSRE